MEKCTKCDTLKNIDEFIKGKKICKICWSNKMKEYYQKNKEQINKKQLEYYYSNQDARKNHYHQNKEKIKQRTSEYYKKNKVKINKQKIERHKERVKTDTLYHITYNIRKLIGVSLRSKNFTKKSRTYQILGCSYEEFKQHLENQFEPWMTWDNYGLYNGELNYGWDIDHIIPTSSAITEDELIKLNHYTNLKPLCSKINRDIKRNKAD